MPNPTLYDNFSQVRQYIDEHSGGSQDLSAYVSKTELSNCGYITTGDVSAMGYITSSDLPVIDESILPKTTNTYTLGNSNHLYSATYTSNLYANTIHNFIWTGTQAEYDLLPNYTTYQFYLIQES